MDLISSDNIFGIKLFKEINSTDKDKNIFISPLSVAFALGMTYNGAKGTTQEAMQTALELTGLTLEEVNESYKSLMELLLNLDRKVILSIANSIWYRQEFEVEQNFIDLNTTYFNAEVTKMDFMDPNAPAIINNWVSNYTSGKIKEVIDFIDPLTVMYLINAIYFKGSWTYQFDPKFTRDDNFNLTDGSQKSCRMMGHGGEFHYFENDNFQVVDLPYHVGNYSMTVFLPKPEIALDDFITQITPENWNSWINSLSMMEGDVNLPKFKLSYEVELNDILAALGMGVAFVPEQADFSGINATADLFLSGVLHKTYVDVNEEGTEAAAVTVVTVGTSSISDSFYFRADRPFLYAIRETNSGAILFIGKIIEPVLD